LFIKEGAVSKKVYYVAGGGVGKKPKNQTEIKPNGTKKN
jgi:hypothetical protein